MVEYDVNPYPILLSVNFWEIRPKEMGPRLDELRRKGVTQFATFVPWQVAESDITHTLARFIQAVSERRMKVFLILSPEVGIHYPHSGLPKDVISRKENAALDCKQGKIPVHLPPNSFYLPSLFAPEFCKRYFNFLGRMDNFFSDLNKSQPHCMRALKVVITGSFWKYYRSPKFSAQAAYGGYGGDYSAHAALAYRNQIENFFSQKEFNDPTPAAANRWKTRALEEVNRRWFYQHSEEAFKNRTLAILRRKLSNLPMLDMELFTPEADPHVAYSQFLQNISGGHSDFFKLSSQLEESAIRGASNINSQTVPYFHWTSMGGFRQLAESEKQYLILKSLLLVGGQGGGVIIDESEWFSFSHQFRSRVEILANSLVQGEFRLRNQVLYLSPHLWSDGGDILNELTRRVGCNLKIISSPDSALNEPHSKILFIDPSFIMTRELIQKITSWAKAGRVVVFPRTSLYTEAARQDLENLIENTKKIDVDLGMTYQLHALGDGKIIIFDMPDRFATQTMGEALTSLQGFINASLSVAEVENYCALGDSRLKVIPLERKNGDVALFVCNGTRRQVTADIIFPTEVEIKDLGAMFIAGGLEEMEEEEGTRSNRFSLEVPPYGILPLKIEGLDLTEYRERQLAAINAEATRENAFSAAMSGLSGFDPSEDMGELWI